jgi:hypothetical protein
VNKFCNACVTKFETKPDERRDAGDRPRTFKPDPGEACDYCPEQATRYATNLGPAPAAETKAAPKKV